MYQSESGNLNQNILLQEWPEEQSPELQSITQAGMVSGYLTRKTSGLLVIRSGTTGSGL